MDSPKRGYQFALTYIETVVDKKVSYRKQIARQHSWSTV